MVVRFRCGSLIRWRWSSLHAIRETCFTGWDAAAVERTEDLELGEPMEESLVSVEPSGARRTWGRYHANAGLKGS